MRGAIIVANVVRLRSEGAALPLEPGGPLVTFRLISNSLETCHD
jgi:hypothetical protein